jgi:hypothetical protein
MCIFSQEVQAVYNTRIFARMRNGRQIIVYQMGLHVETCEF